MALFNCCPILGPQGITISGLRERRKRPNRLRASRRGSGSYRLRDRLGLWPVSPSLGDWVRTSTFQSIIVGDLRCIAKGIGEVPILGLRKDGSNTTTQHNTTRTAPDSSPLLLTVGCVPDATYCSSLIVLSLAYCKPGIDKTFMLRDPSVQL